MIERSEAVMTKEVGSEVSAVAFPSTTSQLEGNAKQVFPAREKTANNNTKLEQLVFPIPRLL